MGDFYEMFFEDAITASKILEITLTSRNKGKDDSIPLCGIPYHAASSYIAKLIENGFKVAVCEQIEDPREAKGIVKREVVRIITPSLFVDEDSTNIRGNAFLMALVLKDDKFGLAFLDISTGEFLVTESQNRDIFIAEISGLDFREVIIEEDFREKAVVKALSQGQPRSRINFFTADYFDHDAAVSRLREYFSEDLLAKEGILKHQAATAAAGAILRYVEETQKSHLGHISVIRWYETDSYLVIDEIAKRNLELFATITENRKEGSLFHILDETVTSMGTRRLRWWLNYPLMDRAKIRERLESVTEMKEQHVLRRDLRNALSGVYDLERLASRISMGVVNGRDLIALMTSLNALPQIRAFICGLDSLLLASIYAGIDEMPDICSLIERGIAEDPPMTIREGGIIKEGYDQDLDELISISRDGRKWIAALEEKERKRTGINSLKIGFNSVFGYYIEVTKTNTDHVPHDYIRKQTLVNAERYINQELKEYESTVLSADDRRKEREYDLFVQIRGEISKEIRRIQATASHIADLDALASLADVAERNNYCCPVVDSEDRIEIKDGRHPVVERMPLPDGFVPNDALLDLEENRLLIITGPNMAGKSTYIRQTALIVILAQTGSFVPAAEARIGIVDRIFTRIGAADSLA
jgi:DNA mismatch repair protein MutS